MRISDWSSDVCSSDLTAEGKLYLFVAIDRTSKFAYAELHEKAAKMVAAQFLRNLVAAVPYAIHTVLTDNGIQFTNRNQDRHAFEHRSEERRVGKACVITVRYRWSTMTNKNKIKKIQITH